MSNNLVGFRTVFDNTINNELQDNLIEFFDWGLLEKGNYFNVTLGETSHEGFDYSRLQPSISEHYSEGQAWEGFRKNWIWQSGVNPPSGIDAPIVGTNNVIPGISGIYVDDTFYPSDTVGQYSHCVDYFNGTVVFNDPIPTGSKVQAEYSYKYINLIYANAVPWLREVQTNTLQNKTLNPIPTEMKIQLPAIAVEVVPARTMKGLQLGGGQWVYTDVLFHCIAENDITRNSLVDIVSYQNDRSIKTFDTVSISSSNDFSLDYRGVPNSGALSYPQMLSKYPGSPIFLKSVRSSDSSVINSNIYLASVRFTVESVSKILS